jgi:hypothetical protein
MQASSSKEEVEDTPVFFILEDMPMFPGGDCTGKWNSGKQDDKPIRVSFIVLINFVFSKRILKFIRFPGSVSMESGFFVLTY